MTRGAILVSLVNGLAFLVALLVAFLSHDGTNLALLIGAVIANASTTISFWLGSSAGSARKTELLAQAPAIVPPLLPTP
jgi:hypothetical protein